MVRWLAVTAAVIAVGLTPGQARACSHPCWYPWVELIAPTDRQEGVPLNAEVKVRWNDIDDSGSSSIPELELRKVNGAAVPVTVVDTGWSGYRTRAFAIRPGQPLEPQVTYEVRSPFPPMISTQTSVIGYFTTGEATVAPPVMPFEGSELFAGDSRTCGSHDTPVCCEPHVVSDVEWYAFGLGAMPITRTYTIREGERVVASNLVGDESGIVDCEAARYDCGYGQTRYPWTLPPGTHTLTFEAVDLAGNVSERVARSITGNCTPPPSDAGVVDADLADDGGRPNGSSAGCGCRVGGEATGVSGAVWVAVGLALRRRRLPRSGFG